MNAEIKPMTVFSSVNGDANNNDKSPSAIYGLLLALTVIITTSEFLLFLSFDFELRQLLYLAAIATPLLSEALHKHLKHPIIQKSLPHAAFLGVFSCFSSQLFADINAYNLIPVIGLVLLVVWYQSWSVVSHWVALGATLILAFMLLFYSGIPIESAIVDSLLVLTPIAYFSMQSWFAARAAQSSASEIGLYHQDMPVAEDVFEQELADVSVESEQDWPRVLRELQSELRNITDVDRLFKTLLLFMSGAIEVEAAAVGMIQERSIKKIARIGDDQLLGSTDLQWTGDRIKHLLAAGGEVIENAASSELSRVDIPLLSNHKAQGVVTLFRRKPFNLSESRLASSIVSQGMLLLKLARLQDDLRKSASAGHKGGVSLLSREQFVDQAGSYIEKLNNPRVFSLLIIEIDKFEDQLDQQGHDVKTSIYKKISSLIISELNDADLIGRYGHDGFMVLLNETDLLEAKKIAETIKDKVAMTKHNSPTGVLTMTVSIGLTTTSEELDDMQALIRKADMGLFVAKESGYNSVKVSL